jgi:hypothetical protein
MEETTMQTKTHATTSGSPATARRLRRAWNSRPMHFIRHYSEMVVAMFVGMFALGMPLAASLTLVGIEVSAWRTDAQELLLLGMAFTMSVPMAAWMRYRGHGWAPAWEMTASMFVPSVAAIGLLWAGAAEDSETLLLIQHVGMLPSMLAVMLLRLDEYTGHGGHAHAAA